MRPDYIKQKIKQCVEEVLLGHFKISGEAEVVRYNYGTKLGTLKHIDYAIPLFGYARQAGQDASNVYARLEARLHQELPCKTEFVNGYMNIMLDDEFLKDVLLAHQELAADAAPLTAPETVLVCSTNDSNTDIAAKLIQECLLHCRIKSQAPLYPVRGKDSELIRPSKQSDQEMRHILNKLPGIVQEPDSKVVYLQAADETYALCTVKGRWYPTAFVATVVKQQLDQGNRVFILGRSEHNQLIRSIFPKTSALDVDVHAKHLNETFQRSIRESVKASKAGFGTPSIGTLDTNRRRELIYTLDFDYEVMEALQSGDLKRLMGEITTLMGQHPVPNVS